MLAVSQTARHDASAATPDFSSRLSLYSDCTPNAASNSCSDRIVSVASLVSTNDRRHYYITHSDFERGT